MKKHFSMISTGLKALVIGLVVAAQVSAATGIAKTETDVNPAEIIRQAKQDLNNVKSLLAVAQKAAEGDGQKTKALSANLDALSFSNKYSQHKSIDGIAPMLIENLNLMSQASKLIEKYHPCTYSSASTKETKSATPTTSNWDWSKVSAPFKWVFNKFNVGFDWSMNHKKVTIPSAVIAAAVLGYLTWYLKRGNTMPALFAKLIRR